MDVILNQIELALDRSFHYLAVTSALTLPSICAALETASGMASGPEHKQWCENWFLKLNQQSYSMINGNDLWLLRCGVAHQGTLAGKGMTFDRVVFTLPGSSFMHGCISSDNGGITESAVQFDAATFCRDMTASVRQWYTAKQNDANIQKNMPHLLQFRPTGISPHFIGIPVIA